MRRLTSSTVSLLGKSFLLRASLVMLSLLCATASPARAGSLTPTTTTLSVSPGASVSEGTALTLQASVDDGDGLVPGGSVTFYDGSSVLAVVQIVYSGSTYTPGTANYKLFLGPGSHSLKATYGGTASFLPSTSTTTTVTVTMPSSAVTATAITSSGSTGNYTLHGAVTAYSSTAATGNVSFADQSNSNFALGTAALDPATLTSGWQTFTPSATASPDYAVILGDLNGDGIPDLITTNYSGTTVSAFLGNGDGTFQAHVDYAVSGFAFGMALGDLNGDGIPDLAVAAHNASIVRVLLGNGDGTFQAAQPLTTAGTSQYVVMADFNRDGILDLATCSSGGSSLSVLLGNGDGTFKTQQSFGTGSFTYGIAAGDFNNDGLIDLAVSKNSSNTISVFLSNGDGSFQTPTDYTVAASPTTIATADLDGDGNLDLVVGNQGSSAISVLLGNGDGTFQAKADYSGFNTPWGVTVADVNGDGIQDVVVASPNARAVEVFAGKGDGTFLASVTTSTGVTNYVPAVGDLNGDGVVDVVVPSITASNVLVALGSISVTATQAAVSIPGGGSHNIVASYLGDSNSASSTSAPTSLTGSAFTTTLSLNAAPTSGAPGQTFVLTADLSPASSSGYTAGGTVTFTDGSTTLGSSVNLTSGSASFSKSDFSNGAHSITASYSGDTNFTASGTESPVTVTITSAQTITFPTLTSVTYGAAPLQLSATASSELNVAFSVVSGPAAVSGTTLTITGAGTVVIQADQAEDSNYQPAAPVQRTLVVNKAASALALITSAGSVHAGASVTFTATATSGSLPAPTGSAVFLDGSTQLATVAFTSGVATYSSTTLTAGAHSITATYAGDSNFLTSSSSAVAETVVSPDYAITANPSSLTVKRGATGTSVLTVVPTGGFTGQVAFTCTGLPQFTTCTFTPASVMLPGDDAIHTVQFSLVTPAAASAQATPVLALVSPFGILALLSLRRRKQFSRRTLAARIAFLTAILLAIPACGGSTSHQPPLGTSTVTMTASAVGGSAHHSASITITITQ